jgi:dUTP pyrophosphatase
MGNLNKDDEFTVGKLPPYVTGKLVESNIPNKNDDIFPMTVSSTYVMPSKTSDFGAVVQPLEKTGIYEYDSIQKKDGTINLQDYVQTLYFPPKILLMCKKIHPDTKIPTKNNLDDAAFDLSCVADETFTKKPDDDCLSYILAPGERKVFKTGLVISSPRGYFCQYTGRSGLAAKKGVDFMAGTIDSATYRGEWGVVLINHGDTPVKINAGDRIVQFIVLPIPDIAIVEVSELDETNRGTKGWGSSGT